MINLFRYQDELTAYVKWYEKNHRIIQYATSILFDPKRTKQDEQDALETLQDALQWDINPFEKK